jgi:hypothetical protein
MYFKEMIEKFGVEEFEEKDIYMFMLGIITVWWVAAKSYKNQSLTEEEYAKATACGTTAGFGFLYTVAKDWVK